MKNDAFEKKIEVALEKERENIINFRRYFHENPERSGKEYNTQKKVLEVLGSYGIEGKSIYETGVVATIKGEKPGKTIAIRADMDALGLQDEITKPYRSKVDGVCHGCGHDGHTAALLGIAKSFNDNKNELAGSIRLLFQPNEEENVGAEGMIKEGCLANVDHVVGMHLWTPIKVGNVAVTKYMMASVGHFDVKVIGNGGHGSQPQACVNAINVSAQIILALNTITSCRIDPREMAVLSVGEFNSGLANNVIPETALIKGTTRSFSQEILQNIEKEIRLIANGIAESNGAKCEVGFFYGYPATINDDAIMKIAEQTIDEKIGKEKRIEIKPNLGGEDFSYYLEKIPGVFIFVGAGNDTNAIYGHHNPKFDIDEDSIIIGAKILSDIAIRLL